MSTSPRTTTPSATASWYFSFIFTTGEHEIASLPETSPWAEKYGAGPRVQQPEVVDTEPGRIHDSRRDGNSSKITEELVKLIVSAPGGKIAALATT